MKLAGKKIHFMGAGGIGMSALAGIAIDKGAVVSGCDRGVNDQTEMLVRLGADITLGHGAEHAADCDIFVYTSAVPRDHVELLAAGDKAVKRGKFLAELMKNYKSAGIAGTHGKTTTTWMAAYILIANGVDPTVFLGGVTSEMAGNYRCGGEVFISELDESDGSFLEPELEVGVITNIESEHLAYYGTSEKVVEAFEKFAEKNNAGLLIFGIDNEFCSRIYAGHSGRKKAFGFSNRDYGLCAVNVGFCDGMQTADILQDGELAGRLKLPLCGEHNILNAMAALLVAQEFGIELEKGIEALEDVETVGRRMELIATLGESRVFSDYAHHPTEVRAAIKGARELCNSGRILAVFQPHLYSRTRDYAKDFAVSLLGADKVVVAEIYPAREKPIAGVTSELIREEIRRLGGSVDDSNVQLGEINDVIKCNSSEYSMILCIGAGDIDAEVRKIAIN